MAGNVMRYRGAAILTALALVIPDPSQAADAPERPHILVILADDLGWRDVGYHGSEIETPHIDRIASRGIELEHFYGSVTEGGSRVPAAI